MLILSYLIGIQRGVHMVHGRSQRDRPLSSHRRRGSLNRIKGLVSDRRPVLVAGIRRPVRDDRILIRLPCRLVLPPNARQRHINRSRRMQFSQPLAPRLRLPAPCSGQIEWGLALSTPSTARPFMLHRRSIPLLRLLQSLRQARSGSRFPERLLSGPYRIPNALLVPLV